VSHVNQSNALDSRESRSPITGGEQMDLRFRLASIHPRARTNGSNHLTGAASRRSIHGGRRLAEKPRRVRKDGSDERSTWIS
jgi:hypothetical protein